MKKKLYRIFDTKLLKFVEGVKLERPTEALRFCRTLEAFREDIPKRKPGSTRMFAVHKRYTYTQLTLEQRIKNEQYVAQLNRRHR